jgi:hypothetical protein
MPNVMAIGTNFPRRINNYVPAMAYSSDVNYNGATRVSFGAPLAANATALLNAASVAAGASLDLSAVPAIADPFGRNIVLVAGGAMATAAIVFGWDYLGQPIAEQFTMNGTTPVIGNKCFKALNYVTYTATATTLSIGTGVKLGLPYKTLRVGYEIANGAVVAAGTLQPPSLVDPQTNTTTDPRGSYTTTTTMNGANIISASCDCVNDVNTSNHGGLHGLQQAAA